MATYNGTAGNDTATLSSSFEEAYGGAGDDRLTSTGYLNMLSGDEGNDTLIGSDEDTLYGGMDADHLSVRGILNQLYGGDHDDTLISQANRNTLNGDAGNDTLKGVDEDKLYGGLGSDHLSVSGIFNQLSGGDDDDTLISNSSYNSLNGDAGNDTLTSTAGNNTLTGGTGNDQITSGVGKDTLTGGADADRFIFGNISQSNNATPDVITDFVSGSDKIDVTGISTSALQYGNTTAGSNRLWYSQANNNTDVMMDTTGDGVADTTIRLTGTINLVSSDFIGLVTNTPPTADAVAVSGTEDDLSIDGAVSGADIDGNPLTYAISGTAPAGLAFNSDGTFSYTPQTLDQTLSAGQSREVMFQYVANDGTANSAPQTVTITINGVNDAPVGTAGGVIGTEDDVTIADSVSATDLENDPLTYHLLGQDRKSVV